MGDLTHRTTRNESRFLTEAIYTELKHHPAAGNLDLNLATAKNFISLSTS